MHEHYGERCQLKKIQEKKTVKKFLIKITFHKEKIFVKKNFCKGKFCTKGNFSQKLKVSGKNFSKTNHFYKKKSPQKKNSKEKFAK
jgi:hypothetical protein